MLRRWLRGSSATRSAAARRRSLRLNLEPLEDRTALSNFTAATVSDLIADINAANLAGGSNTITLAAGNRFTLTSIDNTGESGQSNGLPVIAAGDDLTIVGNSDIIERSTATGTPAFRLLDVALGASLAMSNSILQGGLAESGGGVLNFGTFSMDGVTVQNNTAQGGNACGGGVLSVGSLTMTGCTIQNNAAMGGRGYDGFYSFGYLGSGGPGGDGFGGGVYTDGGTVTISNTTFTGNTAQGGDGGTGYKGSRDTPSSGGGGGGSGVGGGLYVASGTLTLQNCSATANVARGGNGGKGGSSIPHGAVGHGVGAGIYIDPAALVDLDAFTVSHVIHNHASTSDDNIFGSYDLIP
jgi:hypothetical protein